MPDLDAVPPVGQVNYTDEDDPESLTNAMARYMGMLDVVRDGAVTPLEAEIPRDPVERAKHIKAAGYFYDATQMGIASLPREALLAEPTRNSTITDLLATPRGRPAKDVRRRHRHDLRRYS